MSDFLLGVACGAMLTASGVLLLLVWWRSRPAPVLQFPQSSVTGNGNTVPHNGTGYVMPRDNWTTCSGSSGGRA
jgi:hypothetical protein